MRHEKVRFRREDMVELDAMPSAEAPPPETARPSWRVRAGGRVARVAAAGCALIVLLVVGLYFAAVSIAGSDLLQREAAAAIGRLSGFETRAELGRTGLSVDSSRFVALRVADVELISAKSGVRIVEAGEMRFGIRFLPLLTGKVRLGSASIEDARIALDQVLAPGSGDWTKPLRNAEGLLDPGRAPQFVIGALNRVFDALGRGLTDTLTLRNVEIALPAGSTLQNLVIVQATLTRGETGELVFDADLDLDTQQVTIAGRAQRRAGEPSIERFVLSASAANIGVDGPGFGPPGVSGSLALTLSGVEGSGVAPSRIQAEITLADGFVDTLDGPVGANARFRGELVQDVEKLEIRQLDVETGRSAFRFHGAVGPRPDPAEDTGPAAYRYELVSDGSTLAPLDSPEPALDVLARVAGLYHPDERRLTAEEIGVRTGLGEAVGKAAILFAAGKTPGVTLSLDIATMPVAHAKQLWPYRTARNTRRWALKNVYGGTMVDSRLSLDVAPGRLASGVPLTAAELSGHFELEDTRFDTVGDLPAVRDAFGSLDLAGTQVVIALRSGAAFMPSGRSVAVSEGTLRLDDTHIVPVIGKLDIGVAGDAPAVVEFASNKPIDAMRRLAIAPEDIAGSVTGRVEVDFPLTRTVLAADLDWKVALDYIGLSLKKEFEGQRLTEAEGTITVDPDLAVISAEGRLNGIPATIELTEPLGGDASKRRRDVALKLDDKARDALAPGLNTMLSGTISLQLQGVAGAQEVVADLTPAKLSFPWIGWSKGAGVPAKVTFGYSGTGGDIRLSDFRLTGESFALAGDIRLAKGALQLARFDEVRLNRGDDVEMSISRAGRGYGIAIKGSAFDARSAIKLFLSASGEAESAVEATPIKLDAAVESLTGFGGETLRNVRLAFSGSGSRASMLDISAVSKNGGAMSVRNGDRGGKQSVQVQSADAGAVLRFLDIYPHMEGGAITVSLQGSGGVLRGPIEARDFDIVNEPRLRSLVSTAPDPEGKTLNQAVRRDIDVSRVTFERGFARMEKRNRFLAVTEGVIRGPLIGTTFQGTLYDERDRMAMTGTFMPAYGLNRIFAEIPLVGAILGNGRDRGLIGITFKLAGKAASPQLQINPISVIAPGVFRQIFEF